MERTSVRRGFTGHDHDDELGLINMRGRVYDPVQRRFLTPDPVFAAEAYPAGDGAHAIGASGLARAARVGAVNEATGGVGGVLVGGSDASGFQPTTIASAGSARAPSFRPAGAVPVAGAVANRHGGRSHVFDRYNSYSYVKNSPLKYVDPSGFDPVGVDLDGVEYVVVRGNVQAPPTSFEQALMDIDDTGAFRGAHSFLTGMLASMPLFVGVGGPSIGDVAMAAGVADRSSAIAYYAGMLATGLVMSGRGAPAAVAEGAGAGGGGVRMTLFHGTEASTAERFLAGASLNAAEAAAAKIDGPAGFFLATHAEDAAYFAARRGQGTVLQYTFSPSAVETLGGLQPTPLGPLGRFGQFLGGETVVRPDQFSIFNSLRSSGHIVVSPFIF